MEEMSYEYLFEVLMREKSRDELQKIPKTFYADARRFVFAEKQKARIDDHYAHGRIRQLNSMLTEIYTRREKKIIMLATVKVKTNADVFDASAMLTQERDVFAKLVNVMTSGRYSLLEAELPEPEQEDEPSLPKESVSDIPDAPAAPKMTSHADTLRIRFLRGVTRFVGEELEPYGPFDVSETAELPRDIAQLLIDRGDARSH